MTAAEPQVGDLYVWHVPQISFGPIFLVVRRVIRGQRPRAIFSSYDPNRDVTYNHVAQLPLSTYIVRRDWCMEDVRKERSEK